MKSTWNPARERTLREMWARGCSATDIANELGFNSRGAVLGFVRRHNISRDEIIPKEIDSLGTRSIWDLPEDERRAAFARVAAYGARKRLEEIMGEAA